MLRPPGAGDGASDRGPPAGCGTCESLTFDAEWAAAFGVARCGRCTRDEHLVSKSTAKELYLVTDRDLARLGFVTRKNPHGGGSFAPMRLYLESQVAAAAAARHGPDADLDAARTARVEARLRARAAKREADREREGRAEAKVKRARAALEARAEAAEGGGVGAKADVEEI